MSVAHLHVHSHYSFGRGTASPEALCAAAARRGVEAVALTDLDGLYGVPDFLAAAARHGLHAVVGAALPDAQFERSRATGRALVLARDVDGYGEICQLVAERRRARGRPLAPLLERLSDRVWVLSPDLSLLKQVRRARGPHFLLAELRAGAAWTRLAEEADAIGIPCVGTAAVQLADASDRRFQRLLVAVHGKLAFARVGEGDLASERAWMLDEGAMRAAFGRWPEAPARALEVARDCRVGDLGRALGGAPMLGRPGQAAERLRARAMDALRDNGDVTADDLRRLEHELDVLGRPGRGELLELLAEVVDDARERGLLVCAEPTAWGTLLAWTLGLSPLPPGRSGIPLSAVVRGDGPVRLDLRVAAVGRPRVLESLRRRLGADAMARPGAFVRWGLRGAVRDVGRSASLAPSDVEQVLRLLPSDWRGEAPDELVARCPRLRGSGIETAPWDRVLKAAARLAGRPLGLGVGEGIVVAPGPLADRVPVEPVDGRPVCQWDREQATAMGLLALGLAEDRGSELLLGAAAEARAAAPELAPLQPLLGEGAVVGCPGLEGPEVRRALLRDGADSLDAVLAAMAGVPAEGFAEARVAAAVAAGGLDDGFAEQLREALQDPRGVLRRGPLRRRLIGGLQAAGVSRVLATHRWDSLVAEVPTAPRRRDLLAEAVAGLRALELSLDSPGPFFAGLLANRAGAWPLTVVAAEARRRGLALHPPCVQDGPLETAGGPGVVKVGLQQVRGVREELALLILADRRERGPYPDLAGFLARIPASADEADALIAAGALDGLRGEHSRAGLRRLHRHIRPYRTRARTATRRKARPAPPPVPAEGVGSLAAQLREELGALGFAVSGHPVGSVRPELPDPWVYLATDEAPDPLAAPEGAEVSLVGWLAAGALGGGPPPPELRWWVCFDCPARLLDVSVPDRLVRGRGGAARAWWVRGRVRVQGGFRWIEAEELVAVDRLVERAA